MDKLLSFSSTIFSAIFCLHTLLQVTRYTTSMSQLTLRRKTICTRITSDKKRNLSTSSSHLDITYALEERCCWNANVVFLLEGANKTNKQTRHNKHNKQNKQDKQDRRTNRTRRGDTGRPWASRPPAQPG